MPTLLKKQIIIGMTGSIACYKVADLVRDLIKEDVLVDIVMTKSAQNFITKTTMQALSGRIIFDDSNNQSNNAMDHINLTREADLMIIVPASANFISKLAHGIADDLLSTMCLARKCPLYVAPAMNKEMWTNPVIQRNVKQLISDGIKIIGPIYGKQACGEEGYGKLVDNENLLIEITSIFQEKLLANKNILITAGPTIEPIDPVRFISNKSSGKMGYAIARSAYESGANVTLITGPTKIKIPNYINVYNINTTDEMYNMVMKLINNIDIFISVAAVADWKVKNYNQKKIKKLHSEYIPEIQLEHNHDILAEVANLEKKPFCVGFAAETDDLKNNAQKKLIKKNLDMIIANIATDVMDSDDSEVILIDSKGSYNIPKANKLEISRILIKEISTRFYNRQ
ncbi:bifunctional phosphopantothenoylcysteine decarboxylase/phosphopantothenate--cysteine ligase CoaBC [Candidatus Kinetoplastidibacterium crithidiae]|uniref:Coenzyme A biosynthesis bifunctional protein CoaBC n=1 Tax=Candidatus Kinetoplastidibacterium crithidiae TCC036E TaxID=1208918 RepID=M1LWA2_9PROT|nr:bifunctional phosphopantothenoylcysteine decarboxylase/phosphopantothenate--cysteine ligase CoaBC [Candidatus Kinetoplastibacterium crithidii]AFZ82828.1 phosphopantothenoylcysteine decarboxylase/phosphopantothenate synthase [Candidatus Kinetoplastibacterium crithidii (ex Angomonas deanei ATCC 30255)]AGF47519.1 phosphopantothenoylcysteine decarboxylase [Candidatus Kinetoplastibacterium crithidii TCC036E]